MAKFSASDSFLKISRKGQTMRDAKAKTAIILESHLYKKKAKNKTPKIAAVKPTFQIKKTKMMIRRRDK